MKGEAQFNISLAEVARFMQKKNLKQPKLAKQQMIQNLLNETQSFLPSKEHNNLRC
jgi:hypothetical protein